MCISKSSVYYGECSFIVEVSEIWTLWFLVKSRGKWRLLSTLHFVDNEFISSHQSFMQKLCTRCNAHWLHNNRAENQAFLCTRYSGTVTYSKCSVSNPVPTFSLDYIPSPISADEANKPEFLNNHPYTLRQHSCLYIGFLILLKFTRIWFGVAATLSLMPGKVRPTAS